MKLLAVLALLIAQPVFAAPGNSLVRINSTIQTYNAAQPWEKNPPQTRRGLGAVLSGNRILTTAAMAADSIYIELQSADSTLTVPAKVTAIDYDANLALLAPDADAGFLETLTPAEFSAHIKAGDSLSFFQLEDNGASLETQGTIRSMELLNTFVSSRYFLGYVAKASMQTSGNSFTLPAFHDGKLAGVLTSYDAKDQLCDVISIDIVSAFLEDAKDGSYEGFPSLGVGTTTTEDPHFRAWLKLPENGGGLYVTRVLPGGSAETAGLKEGDVIIKVSGFEIDRRGYFQHPEYGVLYWPHLIRGAAKMGENMKIDLLRDGEMETIEASLKASPDPLIPTHAYDQAPPFLIKGGLVFQELSRAYLEAFGKDWTKRAPLNLLDVLSNPEDYEEGRRRVVILTRVVATEATIGYDRLNSQIITSVNGKPIAGLPELAAALEAAPENGIHAIVTDEEPYTIFLDEAISNTVDADFLKRGIPTLSRLYKVTP
ncbi:MAG: PDZ domain-containing protein [Akkermansiaceae bacterium]|jgi:S1-C subfamily serine protease